MKASKILNNVDLAGGGSGRGVSFYSVAANCGKKSQLLEILKEQNVAREEPNSVALDTGTLFHALMEWHYGREDVIIEVDDFECNEAQKEALRLYLAYRDKRPDWHQRFDVVGVEYPLEFEAGELFEDVFTCRMDMVVKIDEPTILQLEEEHPEIIGQLYPGLWLWDFKTAGASDRMRQEKANLRPQFLAYQMAWNKRYPDNPCQGLIGDWVVKNKVPKFRLTVTPQVTPHDENVVTNWIAYASEQHKMGRPNLTECVNFGVCQFYNNGMCNRL